MSLIQVLKDFYKNPMLKWIQSFVLDLITVDFPVWESCYLKENKLMSVKLFLYKNWKYSLCKMPPNQKMTLKNWDIVQYNFEAFWRIKIKVPVFPFSNTPILGKLCLHSFINVSLMYIYVFKCKGSLICINKIKWALSQFGKILVSIHIVYNALVMHF